jgi:hopanoid-associated phosphorylase
MELESAGAPVLAVCGLGFEAAIAAGPGVVTVCATGPMALAKRLDTLLAAPGQACGGIVSFGSAGGLDPALAPGTCVLASAVLSARGCIGTDHDWMRALLACLPHAFTGALAAASAPVDSVAAKARLWQRSGALAADMESHVAALAAQRHGLPFAALRVVLDPAWRALPPAATAGLRADGAVALWPVLRALAARPGQVAQLAVLAADLRIARRALRGARALAGPAFSLPPRRP